MEILPLGADPPAVPSLSLSASISISGSMPPDLLRLYMCVSLRQSPREVDMTAIRKSASTGRAHSAGSFTRPTNQKVAAYCSDQKEARRHRRCNGIGTVGVCNFPPGRHIAAGHPSPPLFPFCRLFSRCSSFLELSLPSYEAHSQLNNLARKRRGRDRAFVLAKSGKRDTLLIRDRRLLFSEIEQIAESGISHLQVF